MKKTIKAWACVGVNGNLVWIENRPLITKKRYGLWIYADRGLKCTITYSMPKKRKRKK